MEGLLVLVSTEEAFNLNYCESSAGTLGIACLCVGTGATSARTGWGWRGDGGLGSTKPVGLRNLCLIVRHLVWKEWICMETGLLYRQSPGCPVQPPGCTCLQSGWSPLHNDQNWDWDTSLMSMTLSMSVSMVGTRSACRDAECLKVPRPTRSMLKSASLKKVPRKIPNGSKLK